MELSIVPSRALTTQVKADVLPFCVLNEEVGAFTLPDLARLRAARTVVATCGAAGILREAFPDPEAGSGLGLGFTHCMIDEAGQVRQADSWVPMHGMVYVMTGHLLSSLDAFTLP